MELSNASNSWQELLPFGRRGLLPRPVGPLRPPKPHFGTSYPLTAPWAWDLASGNRIMELYTLQGWVMVCPCVHPAHPIGVCLGLPPPAVRKMMEVEPHCACSTQGPPLSSGCHLGCPLGLGGCKEGAQQHRGWILHWGELLLGPSFPGGTWGPGMQPGTRVCPQWRAGPVADVNPLLQINNQPPGGGQTAPLFPSGAALGPTRSISITGGWGLKTAPSSPMFVGATPAAWGWSCVRCGHPI